MRGEFGGLRVDGPGPKPNSATYTLSGLDQESRSQNLALLNYPRAKNADMLRLLIEFKEIRYVKAFKSSRNKTQCLFFGYLFFTLLIYFEWSKIVFID